MVEPQRKLVSIGGDLRGGRVGVKPIGAGGVVRQGVARQDSGYAGINRHREGVSGAVGIGDHIDAGALVCRGHGQHLRGAEHLAEALVLGEIKCALLAVVDVRNIDWAAIGESELIAAKGWNPAGVGGRCIVKVVARVEGRVTHKLEDRSVKTAGAGASNDVGVPGSSAANLGRHPAGAGLDLFHRIHVEVAECGTAHLGVADVGAIHAEGSFNAALAIDGKLGCEVGGAVGVGHGAGGQQQQLAEVALVQRQFAHRLAGELLAAGGGLALVLKWGHRELAAPRECECHGSIGCGQLDGLEIFDFGAVSFYSQPVLPGGQSRQLKLARSAGDSFGLGSGAGQRDFGSRNGSAGRIAQRSLPDCLLRACHRAHKPHGER